MLRSNIVKFWRYEIVKFSVFKNQMSVSLDNFFNFKKECLKRYVETRNVIDKNERIMRETLLRETCAYTEFWIQKST